MAKPPQFPLLRLDPPGPGGRKLRGPAFIPSRKFSPAEQRGRPAGERLQRLAGMFAEGRDPLELRADATGLAPERLLVFELTGDVQNFSRAAAKVPGLEFIGAEDLEPDEFDDNPSLYLLIPDARALRQIVGLWTQFQAGRAPPEGFAPWRDLFAHLRDVRPWGPHDRITTEDAEVLAQERADERGMVRLELELVFRPLAAEVELSALVAIAASGGELVSRSRVEGAKYHALLADIPHVELQRVLERSPVGLVAAESVMHIRPQSVLHTSVFENGELPPIAREQPEGPPIAAIFDAVPLAAHPRLAGRLSVDDPFDLEAMSVGRRIHGTAMASAVIHGDLSNPASSPLERPVFFVSVMYAPGGPEQEERFPDRLPADLFHEAVLRMKTGDEASAPTVILINASLGDRNKPFTGRMSGWARVVDYLAYTYGLLFVISAGNHLDDLVSADVDATTFEGLDAAEKARAALRTSANGMAHRRLLAPAESVNALTVGALHSDNVPPGALPAWTYDVWLNTGLCTVSSALGPGMGNSVKPDVLAPGGRHHVRLLPDGGGHILRPFSSERLGGILVAAPASPAAPSPDQTSRTVGTSVAAATLTGVGARIHEALEAVYPDFLTLPGHQRAVLLKALLVHCARWTSARELILEVLGPTNNRQSVRQKDNIRRYLGYGAVDPRLAIECATDRATLWGVGRLLSEQSHTFAVPLPTVMSGKARPHEISVTVAWFTPPRVGALNYRGVRLRVVEPQESATLFAVKAPGDQPDSNQAHRGTVIHRRWTGERAAALAANSRFELMVQRQPDDTDDPIAYAVVATVTMPGVQDVYVQVRDRLAVRPLVSVSV